MSKMNLWLTLEFNIAPNQQFEEIEDMLNQELPALRYSIPEIISGPYYKGVWEIVSQTTGAKYKLNIICECDTKNSRIVRRELNRAVIILFEKYNFKFA